MTYDALNVPAMEKLKHELLEPLEQAGMTPIAAFNIKNEIFRPTFNIYYLTKPNENADHEAQLRQLKNGDDIDFDLLANAVTIVKQDASFSMVYIGKLLGFKSKLGVDEAAIAVKLADYKKFLTENKKEFIASKTHKLEKPIELTDIKLNYLLNIYFFQ
jgi:ASC-1-like (ASCH) protein